jgi:hypothetical protein
MNTDVSAFQLITSEASLIVRKKSNILYTHKECKVAPLKYKLHGDNIRYDFRYSSSNDVNCTGLTQKKDQ